MKNVVFVGIPAMGCLVSGNVNSAVLPESRLGLQFGTSLNIRPDLSEFEGIGFAPTLWVPLGESLDRVLKFAQQYGFGKK